ARALAVDPHLLLLDEPFGALDANVRRDLRRWLRQIHEELGITTLFVTHDQEEALDLADRVVILDQGRIVQEGTPREVCRKPASAFVSRFLGDTNLLQGRVRGNRIFVNETLFRTAEAPDGPVEIHVRPSDLSWSQEEGIPVTVLRVMDRPGGRRILASDEHGHVVEADVPADTEVSSQDRGFLRILRADIYPAAA